ncbi:MAG: crossover junction endodeoxyribonuclease RuvC [Candidatus Wildermuthbacteria bacterium]|nr:crossover junction endodeoxyribonuclease RuvC [Candidatus Wildermuthbacteria bacterium]MBI2121092.1 crossover junction endodeoxyribonuclease RuvC [Candidatus Wildermuthbacteria bacterium]MBI2647999.1 crossover junction endodeoxyribonuclease RuvC [Candidatus Wildermuthbacteria bacterium]
MIILGLDPGTAITGYGVIKISSRRTAECLAYGCIRTSKDLSQPKRLVALEKGVQDIVKQWAPRAAAVEQLYFFKNLKTALPVSEARGVILCALEKMNIPIREFTPLQIKMAITGYGRAEKIQVQKMVQRALRLPSLPKPDDAADALGIAIACSYAISTNLRGPA